MVSKTKPVVLHAHDINTAPIEHFPPSPPDSSEPNTGNVTWKTLLSSSSATPSDTFVSGIATCAPNGGYLAQHRHTHPELYYVISGSGTVYIEGEEYPVKAGSVLFIPGDALHGVVNGGKEVDGELKWLYVFAAGDFAEVVYRFEGDGGRDGGVEEGLKVRAKL